jgi:acyl-[acyl carrier protein]--UDP-N-acetylglucosamine O-acyltransferase
MFTGNRISLSRISADLGLTLWRDAEIAYVGKVPTRLEARLVPAGKPAHMAEAALASGIAAYVVPADLSALVPERAGVILSDQPVATAMTVHEYLCDLPGFLWTDFDSVVDPSARIMPGAQIAPRNVRIGAGTVIGPNAVVLERSEIGAGCQIGANVVIGMEAFEQKAGASPKALLRQAGGISIGDHVTILPGCTIARSTFGGFNRIGDETKIDALTYIAHDCVIGARVTICACCDISGRVEIGDNAYLGPNCTISNGLRIGTKSIVSLGAVVTRDVPDGARVSGNFGLPHENWLKFIRAYR